MVIPSGYPTVIFCGLLLPPPSHPSSPPPPLLPARHCRCHGCLLTPLPSLPPPPYCRFRHLTSAAVALVPLPPSKACSVATSIAPLPSLLITVAAVDFSNASSLLSLSLTRCIPSRSVVADSFPHAHASVTPDFWRCNKPYISLLPIALTLLPLLPSLLPRALVLLHRHC